MNLIVGGILSFIVVVIFCVTVFILVRVFLKIYDLVKNHEISIVKILLCICGFFIICFIFVMVSLFLDSKSDSYKMGAIEIPSMSYVLNERRPISSFEMTKNVKIWTYREVDHPTEDIDTYVDYLLREEGFELVMTENRGEPSQRLTLHKEYADLQAHIVIYLECQISHYVITIQKQSEARWYIR